MCSSVPLITRQNWFFNVPKQIQIEIQKLNTKGPAKSPEVSMFKTVTSVYVVFCNK